MHTQDMEMDMADDDQTRQLPPEEPEGGGSGDPTAPKTEGEPGGDDPAAPAPGAPEEPTHELPPAAEEPTREQPSPAAAPGPRRLTRSRDDRLIAGVCGGLGRYFGIDPVIFRVAAVALIFLGGAGALLYLAAIFLVPNEGDDQTGDRNLGQRGLAITGIVLLVVAAGVIFSHGPFHFWPAWPLGVLILIGLAIWSLVTAGRSSGGGTGGSDSPRKTGQRLLLGLLVLIASGAFAIGGAWLAGAGSATAAGIVVLGAAAAVGVGAYFGFGRWLILPAIALAIPVGIVSAAGIDLHGGAGDRDYHPVSAEQLRSSYKLGAGRLLVDVRGTNLSSGDHPLKLRVGLGQAVLVVPSDVCVATKAHVGIGDVNSFEESHGGIDVDWDDPRTAGTNPRIVLDANVGMGEVLVTHDPPDGPDKRPFGRFHNNDIDTGVNSGCEV
jgi:phage shock protein PspC (stress-responsive transcriptional regulator)